MKKIVALLAALMLMMLATTALAAKPGDTVTVPIYINHTNASYVKVRVTGGDWCTVVSLSSDHGAASSKTINGQGSPLLPSGKFGSATIKINDGVASGTYKLTVTVSEAWDPQEQEASVSAYSGSVTVDAPACDHAWDNGVETTAPTCDKDGVKTFTCTKCGETKTEAIPAIGHAYDNGVVTTPATCIDAGVKTFTCANCKGTYTEKIPATGEHAWDKGTVQSEPTCTEEGVTIFTCTVCKETDKTTVPAKGHTASDTAVRVEPTCTENGSISYNCTVCGTKVDGEVLAALGHDKQETISPATCGKAGEKVITCSRCDFRETEAIPATGAHTYGEAVQTKAPTCTEPGEKHCTCTVCGDVKTEEVAALGHTEELLPAVEPTCTETGLTEGKKCSVCGAELVPQKAVKAKGHKKGDWVVVKEATEEEAGVKELRCTVCGELLDSKTFPLTSVTYYPNNTACSVGPCFRDESDLTDKWYRFTPVDLSADGEQTFDLVASNLYIIGQVKATVAEGNVMVEVTYSDKRIVVRSEFCTLLPSLGQVAALDMAQLKNYPFGTPISIGNDLAGDTKVLLFICNEIDYNSGMNITQLPYKTRQFKQQMEDMKLLMD